MMRQFYSFIALIFLIVGCTDTEPTTVESTVVPPTEINMSLGGHALYLHTIEGWHVYHADNHLILTEQRLDQADGMVVNIWIPEIELTPESTAVSVLTEYVHQMRTTHGIPVSDPNIATWGSYDAAYYVMDHDNTLSLIMVVMLPNQQMIALNITGEPMGHEAWVKLGEIFADFRVNDLVLGGDIFASLPATVHSPTMDATPTNP